MLRIRQDCRIVGRLRQCPPRQCRLCMMRKPLANCSQRTDVRFSPRRLLPAVASNKQNTPASATTRMPPAIPIDETTKDRVVARVVAEAFRQCGQSCVVCKDRAHLRRTLRVLAMALTVVDPEVWISFEEVGKIVQTADGGCFRGLQFTLQGGLGKKIADSDHQVFQVTANTHSMNLAVALENSITKRQTVELRSMGFPALLTSIHAVKRLRRKMKVFRGRLFIRPRFSIKNKSDKPKNTESLHLVCGYIPFSETRR